MPRWIEALGRDTLARLGLVALVCFVSLPSLRSGNIDDLDSAHHLLDGYFFHDLASAHPVMHLEGWTLAYYKQYPALGFIFWPPLFPAVLGLFCVAGGDHVLTARVCLLCFGCLFALAFFALLRRQMPVWLAFCAAASALTVPGMVWSFEQIMLELPTLAVMCVALLAYLQVRDHAEEPTSVARALGCALALAAVIYTKQPAYFLYGAVALDALFVPRLVRKRETWILAAAMVVLCLPLVLFTVKFGHADLAQSVGNNTQLIMKDYRALPRWSVAAWTFYPRLAPTRLNPVVLVLGCMALGLAVVSRTFRRANILWLGWFGLAYLTFSFYDNRLARHSTFWWPAWIALAAACLQCVLVRLESRLPSRAWAGALPVLFLLPIPWQVLRSRQQDYSDFRGQRPIVAGLFADGDPGNVLLFGPDKQTFIALIREYDGQRRVHVLRGESLLATGRSLADVCRDYQISRVLVELAPAGSDEPRSESMSAAAGFQRLPDAQFRRRGAAVRVLEYRYTGPFAPQPAPVPLSHRLI